MTEDWRCEICGGEMDVWVVARNPDNEAERVAFGRCQGCDQRVWSEPREEESSPAREDFLKRQAARREEP